MSVQDSDAIGPFVLERWVTQWTRGWSLGPALAVGAGGVAIAGLVDYLVTATAGRSIGVTGLFALAVALAAGAGGRRPGWLIAGLAALVQSTLTWAAARDGPLTTLGPDFVVQLLVYLATAEVLSYLRAHLEQERRMSRTDPATGIANGRSFLEAAAIEVERSRRNGTPISLAYLDVDDFKEVNDSRGHAAGDELLRLVASCLRRSVRRPDFAARVGGDEFVLLLSESGPGATRSAVDRIRLQLREAARAGGFVVTASIGVVTVLSLSPSTTVEHLVAAADAAMYQVKRGSKDAVRYEVIPGPLEAMPYPRSAGPGRAPVPAPEPRPSPTDRPADSATALHGAAWAGRALRYWQSRTPPPLRPVVQYLSAPAGALFAALVQYALLPDPSIAPFVFFYFSVALVSWLAGRGPGLATVLISALIANWAFLESSGGQHSPSRQGLTATLLFAVGSSAVAILCAAFRDALLEAQRTATQLRHQAAVLRHTTDTTIESEERLRTLADNIPQLAWMADRHGNVFWLNERWHQFGGGSLEETQRGGLLHPDHVERVMAKHRRAVELGEPSEDLFPLRAKDGTYRWFLSRLVPIRDERGEVTRWLGTNTDVTEQHQAEQDLRRSETQLRLAKQAAGMGSWDWNVRTGELVWSDRCKALFGLAADTAMTQDVFLATLHPEDRPRAELAAREALAHGTDYDVELRVPWPDGSVHWVASKGQAFHDPTGEPVRMAGMALDVTQRKQAAEALQAANERLKAADRRKDEFLGLLSHELRSPLSPLSTSIHIAAHAAPGSQQERRALGVIDRQVRHLTRLVDDLLDVTRLAKGKVRLRREAVDLQTLARDSASDFHHLFEQNGVELVLSLGDQPLLVDGDPTRLSQVIGNLLHNAVKFSARGTRTILSTRRADEHHAEIAVRDEGVGIPPEVLPKVYEPYLQAEATLERSAGGLGLGLSLVKGLVELQGGRVVAESAGPGRGATFVVRLPLDLRRARRPVTAPPAMRPARRVLVIDDNVDAAESLKEALELNEHSVDLAYTGLEGVQKARTLQPDVVLCDIGLPDIDGFEVAKALRTDPVVRSATLIALSGYAMPEDVDRAKAAGFDLHLAKPPDLSTLERSMAVARAKAE